MMLVGWGGLHHWCSASTSRPPAPPLDGYDATNTDWYPQGSDTGTVAKVSGWQEIGQILGIQGGGGGVRNVTVALRPPHAAEHPDRLRSGHAWHDAGL